MKHKKYVETRFGVILLESENDCLTGAKRVLQSDADCSCPVLEMAAKALLNYNNGLPFDEAVPLAPRCTPFQMAVYREISKIPFGETASYGEIAERIGKKGACRAVGSALNKNPIWIFIPCHRVIGKNKALTGFAGGLEMKEKLLLHEKDYLANNSAICTAFVAAPFLT
ncbi:MAG: methylated-DNA--[Clostridia bacterium]|nr:methylated-DNA--[protein]-cysteine S-methyltransferase [Clostridia bacterium]